MKKTIEVLALIKLRVEVGRWTSVTTRESVTANCEGLGRKGYVLRECVVGLPSLT